MRTPKDQIKNPPPETKDPGDKWSTHSVEGPKVPPPALNDPGDSRATVNNESEDDRCR